MWFNALTDESTSTEHWLWELEQALEQQPDEPSLVKLKNDLTEAGAPACQRT